MGIFEVPIQYDVLVAATEDCIKGYAGDGWVDSEKIHETPGSTKYQLSQDQLGNLGILTLRKLGDGLSAIYFPGLPPFPTVHHKPSKDELAVINATPNRAEWIRAYSTLIKKNRKESIDKYDRRKKHLSKVRHSYFERLRKENIWLTFQVSEKEIAPSEIIEEVQQSTFRRKGNNEWEISFLKSESFTLGNLNGLRYIHELLSSPNKDISVMALYQNDSSISEHPLSKQEMMQNELIEFEGESIEILDIEALVGIQDDLSRRLEAAKMANNDEEVNRIVEDMDWLAKELEKNRGLGGKSRKMSSESEKIRKNVYKAIKTAKEKIRSENNELSAYLDTTIETGRECCYLPMKRPDIVVDWMLL